MTTFMMSLRPSRLVLIGPITPAIGSAPAWVEHQPSVGIRNEVGLNPYTPQFEAGLLMLPDFVRLLQMVWHSAYLQYHCQGPDSYPAFRVGLLLHRYFHQMK